MRKSPLILGIVATVLAIVFLAASHADQVPADPIAGLFCVITLPLQHQIGKADLVAAQR